MNRTRAPAAPDRWPGGAAADGGPGGPPPRAGSPVAVYALLLALVLAVCARRALAGLDPAGNPAAGATFALLLTGTTWLAARRWSVTWTWTRPPAWGWVRCLLLGACGAAVLCAGPLLAHLRSPGGALPAAGFPAWAVVVTAVAISEEAFLRGALWRVVSDVRGPAAALVVTSVAFAVLHVPFYGPSVLPLDLAVGFLLGGLRLVSGGVAAPSTAHVLADLAGWWLR
jgi:membrane protease YdiL (CAAX protease family)